MKITIGPNTVTPGYHAWIEGLKTRYGETRGEALGRLVMAFPDLLAKGVVISHEDDPRSEARWSVNPDVPPPTIEIEPDGADLDNAPPIDFVEIDEVA